MTRAVVALAVVVGGLVACRGDVVGPSGRDSWVTVAAGDGFTCALDARHRAWCWGEGRLGHLGTATTAEAPRPVRVVGSVAFRTLSVGTDHVCAIADDDAPWCWGMNEDFELGVATPPCDPVVPFFRCASVPRFAEAAPALNQVAVSGYASCGIARDGRAWCWGLNDHGQLGVGRPGVLVGTPTPVEGAPDLVSITLSPHHACGLTGAGRAWCWGLNEEGQLGVDTGATTRCGPPPGYWCAPSPIPGPAAPAFTAITAGGSHSCALGSDGDAWCWGSGRFGASGGADDLGGPVPVRVGAVAFAQIDAGLDHTCGLDAAGAAWCWGANQFGQTGGAGAVEWCPGRETPVPCGRAPAPVASSLRFTVISAGAGHSCAVSVSGEVWCWGRGDSGQLGDGASRSSPVPVLVGPATARE